MKKKELTFGRHPVLDALEEGKSFEKIFISNNAKGQEMNAIEKYGKTADIPVQRVPIYKLNKLINGNHQGVVAVNSQVQYFQIQDILDQAYSKGKDPLFLILDHLNDVGNFGAIARTALCTGVDAIITPQKGGVMITGDAIKASAGALNTIPVCRVRFLDQAIDELKLNGLKILTAEMHADKAIFELDLKIPLAIVLGSEEKGISKKVADKTDQFFRLPMEGDFDSLNVSVSAGMALYELIRQRLLG